MFFEIILCLSKSKLKTKTMTNNPQQDLITEDFLNENLLKRATLIPTWIKVFHGYL